MNKKVLTLCAAMLLCGSSLMPVYADAVKPSSLENEVGIEVSSGKMVLTDKYELANQKDYLLLDEDNFVLDGQYNTFVGHIVITGKNVTVQNLHIDYKNVFTADEDGTVTENKTAISIMSDGATIENCVIKCTAGDWLANAITILPTSVDAKFTIKNNQIYDADAEVNGWSASGIQIVEGHKNTYLEEITEKSARLKDFNIAESIVGNTFENVATDYSYSDWTNGNGTIKAVQVTPIVVNGEIKNKKAIQGAVASAAKNAEVIFNGTTEQFIEALGETKVTNDVAVQCIGDKNGEGAGNVLFGNATNPDNGNDAMNAEIAPAVKNLYGYKMMETPSGKGLLALTAGTDTYLVVKEKGENAALVKIESAASLEKYVHNNDALWTMKHYETAGGQHQYKFVNGNNEELKANGTSVDPDAANGTFISKGNAPYGQYGVVLPNVVDGNYWSYALYETADNYFQASQLTKRYGKYFTLAITYKNDKNKDVDVTGEFKGQLHPVKAVSYYNGEPIYEQPADNATSFMLVNEEGNIIVIDTKDPQYTAPTAHGYVFTTITPKQWEEYKQATSSEHNYVTTFKFAYDYNDEVTTEGVTSIEIGGYKVGLEKKGSDIILVADVESHLLETPEISFKLNAGNGIEAKEWLTTPSYYTVEAINKDKKAPHYGKVLGLGENGAVAWVAPENVDLTQPEGQFAIDDTYTFTNRENGSTRSDILIDGSLYKVEDNVYAVVKPAGIDTLRITPVTTYKSSDGFKRFTAAELNNNTYTVAMTQLSSELNIIENHNDKHRLGLDEENATEWRIEMPTVKLVDATGDFTRMAADTVKQVTSITYYAGASKGWVTTNLDPESDYYAPNTELQICTYVLKNTDNGEYLNGKDYSESAGNAYYVCNEDKKTATRIAFKEAGDGTVNLVPVYDSYDSDRDWTVPTDKNAKYESEYGYYTASLYLPGQKIIGGTTTLTGVLKDTYLYSAPSNDVFTINVAEAPTYKKLAQGDKIILTLKENLKDENVLFEDGEFAGMGNRLAHKDINPTLYVDTAYVNREGNFAYQYLLGVRINRVDTTYKCNVPSHGIHRADTTFGDFLVNMVDSALANKDVHNNKFEYNGEYKLAFVPGYHTNDTLFFTNKAGEVVSKMEVGNADFNIAKYAFKMIDEDANEFVVETAAGYATKYNYVVDKNNNWHWIAASVESKPGYLRWVNDNLVVTDDINNAAIFTMEDSELIATANEEISANAAVSVVATDGAVIVKGAEGKNVIVSTILGKVVANEVLNSDNETIAAPAGIVVVSVDGESFKVAVK